MEVEKIKIMQSFGAAKETTMTVAILEIRNF